MKLLFFLYTIFISSLFSQNFLMTAPSSVTGNVTQSKAGKEPLEFDHTHDIWNQVLKQFVVTKGHKSLVKYASLKKSPATLKQYLKILSSVSKKQFQSFTKNEQLAFLINAYNAFTLDLIISHYPVSSIKDIGPWYSTPWKLDFFTLFGEKHTLNDLEHEMIRKWFKEPRIHFALVCAAKSCPPLRNQAYVASNLNSQLKDAARNFLSDKDRNYFNPQNKTLYLSSIFKWYGKDFNPVYGSLKNFLASFYDKLPPDVAIEYLSYNWKLNNISKKELNH